MREREIRDDEDDKLFDCVVDNCSAFRESRRVSVSRLAIVALLKRTDRI